MSKQVSLQEFIDITSKQVISLAGAVYILSGYDPEVRENIESLLSTSGIIFTTGKDGLVTASLREPL